jgi:hypothetical protein
MCNYIDRLIDLVQEREGLDLRQFVTPASKDLFTIKEGDTTLNDKERQFFHTVVAKLLYLSKRTRPDILTTTSFLCTRVSKATVSDKRKLYRVLGYLKATKERKFQLKPLEPLQVHIYIDAAFAPHKDGKSHTGIAVFIGGTLVYAASRKQKCITKSPSDSELVALTDNISFAELFSEFLEFITNTHNTKPLIFEDCTAVISLVTLGGGAARTKHLRVRIES